jgi:hypothetical protein
MIYATSYDLGDDVFVREPTRFLPDCRCIVGPVVRIEPSAEGPRYWLEATIGRVGGGSDACMWFLASDIGHRLGTPISQLSGRPGHRGFDRFCAIATSWGYP